MAASPRLAEWKVALAAWIKLQCGVSNRWFSEAMRMGGINGISKAVAAQLRKKAPGKEWPALGRPKPKACPLSSCPLFLQWARAHGWDRIEVDSFEDLPVIYETTGSAGHTF